MGINSISDLVGPEYLIQVPVSDFAGKRIAIDAPNYIFTMASPLYYRFINELDLDLGGTSQVLPWLGPARERFCESLCSAIGKMIFNVAAKGISLVFVFDGEMCIEKVECRKLRSDRRAGIRAKALALWKSLRASLPLDRSMEDIASLRKILAQDCSILENENEKVKTLIDTLGCAILTADGEGENLCAGLVNRGLVVAAWSTDTDLYALGARIIIKRFSESKRDHFDVIDMRRVWMGMGMTPTQFTDLCIMCGCDFNTNIPKIGPKRARDLITKHGSIEIAIQARPDLEWSRLHHVRCRELFVPSVPRMLPPLDMRRA